MLREIFGFFVGLFRRSSNHRNTEQQLNNIETQNETNKNVIEYRNNAIEAFVPNGAENIVVSGSNDNLRNRVNCASAWRCHESGRPAVILHCSNYQLSQLMDETFNGESGFHNLNSSNPYYDPFVGLNRSEISQMILSSSGSNYKIERIGNSYIYGLIDYLQLIGRPICVESFSNCLRDRSYEQIMEQAERGNISEFIARRINSELAQGKLEAGNIEQYFTVLQQQVGNTLADESSASDAVSIKKALRQNEVIVVDIGDASNSLLLNLVIQEIRDAISSGLRFTLIIDSIPVDSSESLGQLMRNFSGMCSFVYSSPDAYTSAQSTANVFDTLLGRANTVFVLQHSSTASGRFSQFLGQYQKVEVNHTFTSGDTYATFGQILPGSSSANIYGTQLVNRARVEENEISSQSPDHVYIKRSGTNEIISVRCTGGSARTHYEAPQINNSRRPRTSRRRMSWLVFVLLFIFCCPAAFIYSFVKSGRTGKIVSAIFFFLVLALYICQIILIVNGGTFG